MLKNVRDDLGVLDKNKNVRSRRQLYGVSLFVLNWKHCQDIEGEVSSRL